VFVVPSGASEFPVDFETRPVAAADLNNHRSLVVAS